MEVTQEERNFLVWARIVTEVIPESLCIVFKREWDALYAKDHGEWKDTPEYGQLFLSKEKRGFRVLRDWQDGNRMNKNFVSLIQAIGNSESLSGMKDHLRVSVKVLRELRNYHFAHVSSTRMTTAQFHNVTEKCVKAFEGLKVDTTALLEAISLAIPTFTDKESTLRWINLECEVILSTVKRLNVSDHLFSLPSLKAGSVHRSKEIIIISNEIEKLSSLKKAETTALILRGYPGIGKTTLALQYSYDFISSESQSGPKGVAWIIASNNNILLESLFSCGKALGIAEYILSTILRSEYLSHEDKVTTLIMIIIDLLNMHESWLIVVDDVQDIQSFLHCLPRKGDKVRGHGSILITTNDDVNQASFPNTRTVEIGGMSEDDAIQLLSRAGDVRGESYESALAVAKMLDFHPLALSYIAHYINSTRTIDGQQIEWQDIIRELSEAEERLTKLSRKSLKSILYNVIEMVMNREIAKQEMMLAFQYIKAASQKDGIQKRDMMEFIKKRMPEVDENALISSLQSSSLVSANDENSQISVHPIVLSVLQDVVPTDTTVPHEILARGPRAVEAYQKALKDGKVFVFRGRVIIIGQDRAGKTCLRKSLCCLPFKPDEPSTDGVDAALYELDVEHVNASDFRRKDEELLSPDALSLMIAKDLKLSEKSELVEQAVSSPEGIGKDSSDSAEMIHTDEVNKPDQHAQQPQQHDHVASENEATIDEQADESTASLSGEAEIPDDVVESIIKFLQNERIGESIADKQITLSIWDFAGQHLYYASHQVFLSPRATYILVYNLAKDLNAQAEPCVRQGTVDYLLDNPNNETNLDSILSWLNSVHTVCQTEENDEDTRPPVIIVGTHADKPFEDIKEMEKKLKIGILGKSYQKHVIKPFFAANNVKSSNDDGIKNLKLKIKHILDNDPNVGKEEPLRWLHFEKATKSLVSKNTHFLTMEETSKIAEEVCLIDDPDELKTMLDFYHDLGIMIRHANMVVLDAQWLINVFKTLITIRDFDNMDPLYTDHWLEMEKSGKLSMHLIDYILEKELNCIQVKEDLLKMMEHFGLIAHFNRDGNETCYFVPSHLRSSPSEVHEQTAACSCPLYIHFHGGFVPHGIHTRLVCALISWDRVRDEPTLYRDASEHFLDMSSQTVLTVLCYRSSIKLLLQSKSTDRSYIHDVANESRAFVETTLTELKQCIWYKSLRYEICVNCSSCAKKSCTRHSRPFCSEEKCWHLLPSTKDQPFLCRRSCGSDRWPEISGWDIWCPEPLSVIETECVTRSPPKATLDLTDNVKRWVVVGISLNTVLIPPVREYLVPCMEGHYEKLKTDHGIDTQSHPGQLKKDGTFELIYRSINNNDTVKGVANYNYKVASHVDLGKLYMQPYMAKFTDYDGTCDGSAVLKILVSASVFASVKLPAAKVKDDVRNKWGHCNIDKWDESMFNKCFVTMLELVQSLGLPLDDKQRLSDELSEWKNQGVQLRLGENSISEMKSLLEGVGDLFKNLSSLIDNEEKRNYADKLLNDVKTAIDRSLKNEQEIESLKKKNEKDRKEMQSLEKRVTDLEDKVIPKK